MAVGRRAEGVVHEGVVSLVADVVGGGADSFSLGSIYAWPRPSLWVRHML